MTNTKGIANVLAGDLAIARDTPIAYYTVRNVALSLADLFGRESDHFDRRAFLTDCGLKPEDAPTTFGLSEA